MITRRAAIAAFVGIPFAASQYDKWECVEIWRPQIKELLVSMDMLFQLNGNFFNSPMGRKCFTFDAQTEISVMRLGYTGGGKSPREPSAPRLGRSLRTSAASTIPRRASRRHTGGCRIWWIPARSGYIVGQLGGALRYLMRRSIRRSQVPVQLAWAIALSRKQAPACLAHSVERVRH